MSDTKNNITIERKHSHVEICLHGDIGFNRKTTGLERFEFEHNPLPQLSFSDIDLSTTFLGRKIGAPLMISSMTGGFGEAEVLNQRLAEAAEQLWAHRAGDAPSANNAVVHASSGLGSQSHCVFVVEV